MMDAKKFGCFIQTRRKELGLTQSQLAEQLGLTDKAISRWERGVGFPDISLLEGLAQALGVSVVELMRSERVEQEQIEIQEVEKMMVQTIDMAQELARTKWRSRMLRFVVLPLMTAVELFLMDVIVRYVNDSFYMRLLCLMVIGAVFSVGARAVGFIARCEYLNPPKPVLYHVTQIISCIGMLMFCFSWLLNTDGLRHLYGPVGIGGFLLILVYPGYLIWQEGREAGSETE